MTASPPVRPARPAGRTVELVLAHTHLRLGSLALARVELETMAGMGLLDTGGIVDLAEVRWRTGDLLGAGEAASAALRDDPDLPMALVISAEAAAALGRPTEARRLADKATRAAGTQVDAIFAGMPRSGVWPADAAEPPPTAPTLFDREPEPAVPAIAGIAGMHERPVERRPAPPPTPLTLGLWDADDDAQPTGAPMPDPAAELEAGRAALVAGNTEEAALRFGIALRLAPALAPAVLEATDGARGAGLTLVRGDAYRLAGHDAEAQQAYVIAAYGGLPERRKESRFARPGEHDTTAEPESQPSATGQSTGPEAPPEASGGHVASEPAEGDVEPAAQVVVGPETPAREATTDPAPAAAIEAPADGAASPADAAPTAASEPPDGPPPSGAAAVASTRLVASAKSPATSGARSAGSATSGAGTPAATKSPPVEPAGVAVAKEPTSNPSPDEKPTTDGPAAKA